MIRGKKNMLSPSQLVMGLALMFRLADESLVNHVDVRFEPCSDQILLYRCYINNFDRRGSRRS